MSVKCCLASGT